MKVWKKKEDDVNLLLPSFKIVVVDVIHRLKTLGCEPFVNDTLRTTEESLRNAERGTGIVDSMHNHGAAVDIICRIHQWDCKKNGCSFYEHLAREGVARGLVRVRIKDKHGNRFWDEPHLQALEVKDQNTLRALDTWEEKDEFIAKRMRKYNPTLFGLSS